MQYKNALDQADVKIVNYSQEALRIKRRDPIDPEFIKEAFGDQSITVFTEPEELHKHIAEMTKENRVFLMMSSGNYGGLDLDF